jgi:hypothetical protein
LAAKAQDKISSIEAGSLPTIHHWPHQHFPNLLPPPPAHIPEGVTPWILIQSLPTLPLPSPNFVHFAFSGASAKDGANSLMKRTIANTWISSIILNSTGNGPCIAENPSLRSTPLAIHTIQAPPHHPLK